MRGRTDSHHWGVVLDAPDAQELARFYARLLGWKITKEEPGWATIAPADGVTYLGFQTAQGDVRPVWPNADGAQQMMMHLDLEVGDLYGAADHAIETWARHSPTTSRRTTSGSSSTPPGTHSASM